MLLRPGLRVRAIRRRIPYSFLVTSVLPVRSSCTAGRSGPRSVSRMASSTRARHWSLCWIPGRGLPNRTVWSHCGHPSVYPWAVKSDLLIRRRLAPAGTAVSAFGVAISAGSWKLTLGSGRSRMDHGVAATSESASTLHRSDSGRRCRARDSSMPSSQARI